MPVEPDQLRRGRLILGKDSHEPLSGYCEGGCGLSAEELQMDEALEAIYAGASEDEISRDEGKSPTKVGTHGAVKGRSFPRVARWLNQIRNFFPNENRFVKKMEMLLESGLKAVGLLAISDQGQPSYNERLAEKLASIGMPCFGCTPDRLPDLLHTVLKGMDLAKFGESLKRK